MELVLMLSVDVNQVTTGLTALAKPVQAIAMDTARAMIKQENANAPMISSVLTAVNRHARTTAATMVCAIKIQSVIATQHLWVMIAARRLVPRERTVLNAVELDDVAMMGTASAQPVVLAIPAQENIALTIVPGTECA